MKLKDFKEKAFRLVLDDFIQFATYEVSKQKNLTEAINDHCSSGELVLNNYLGNNRALLAHLAEIYAEGEWDKIEH